MTPEIIPEIALTCADEAAIAGLLAQCFDTDFGGRSYFQQRHHLRLVLRDQDRVVAHMALCFRDVRLGPNLTPIAGLAEVATHPEYRGRGLAGQLMTIAVDQARRMRAEFLLLFGDRPLYAGRGFTAQPNVITYLALDGARTGVIKTGRDGGLMVLPLGAGIWDGAAPLDLLGHKF